MARRISKKATSRLSRRIAFLLSFATASILTATIIRILSFAILILIFATPVGGQSSTQSSRFVFAEEPTHIIIPTLGVSRSVETARIALNTWETSKTDISYGQGSAPPGTRGNTVVFAHAKEGLFEDLDKLGVGDRIHIFTSYDWFIYEVTESLIVAPEETKVIFSQGKPELTLFTCTGHLNENRLVVKAKLL